MKYSPSEREKQKNENRKPEQQARVRGYLESHRSPDDEDGNLGARDPHQQVAHGWSIILPERELLLSVWHLGEETKAGVGI